MQDIYYQETYKKFLTTKEMYYRIIHVRKKYHHYMYLKIKDVTT